MSSSKIPTLFCGKSDAHLQAVTEILKEEVEAVKLSKTVDEAIAYLTSSSSSPSPFPEVIAMGGGYSNEDYERLAGCMPGLREQVVWFRPAEFKAGAAPVPSEGVGGKAGPPPPEQVAKRYRKAFDEWFAEGGKEGKGKGEVRYL